MIQDHNSNAIASSGVEKLGDQNLMKVHELLNKHAEAKRKIGFMAKNNNSEMRMDA
jgi:hypothetical protein